MKMCGTDDPAHRAVAAIVDEVDPMEEDDAIEFLRHIGGIVMGMMFEIIYSRRANDG